MFLEGEDLYREYSSTFQSKSSKNPWERVLEWKAMNSPTYNPSTYSLHSTQPLPPLGINGRGKPKGWNCGEKHSRWERSGVGLRSRWGRWEQYQQYLNSESEVRGRAAERNHLGAEEEVHSVEGGMRLNVRVSTEQKMTIPGKMGIRTQLPGILRPVWNVSRSLTGVPRILFS